MRQEREAKVTPCKTHDHSKNFVFYLKCQGKPWEDFEQDITGSYLGVKVLTLAAM